MGCVTSDDHWMTVVTCSLGVILLVLRGVHGDTFTVGYLADFHGRQNTARQGLVISGAMTYALSVINENSTLLKGHTLKMIYNDTKGENLTGTKAIIDQWREGAVAFFGPEDSCEIEATVAASLNLPMISYKCADSKVSRKEFYSTFARTYPPEKRVVRSVIALLRYYQWHKFAIVSENTQQYQTVAHYLEMEAQANFTINSKSTFEHYYICCEEGRDCCENGLFHIVDETYKGTRVYVFIGSVQDLVKMMIVMRMKGLLSTGEYVVIYIDFETYSETQSYKYFWPRSGGTGSTSVSIDMESSDVQAAMEASRSLLVIVPSPPQGQAYNDFEDKVRAFNQKEPFNFGEPFPMVKKHITIYASYLYDSVMLYAQALSEVLKLGLSPRNGSDIIQRIISRKRYQSVTGTWMQIDENGDAEGNYTVLARQPTRPDMNLKGIKGKQPLYTMLPVGSFHYDDSSKFPVFKLLQNPIEWPGGSPCPDEPTCGYDNSGCIAIPDKNREIAASVLASLLVVVSLVAAITYRNWKYEQEIAGLLWRIDIRDIKKGAPEGMLGYLSRMSLVSQQTLESRIFAQVFATTGMYKGTWVAVKELSFTRKTADIARETKIEMKLMREIHQDNINPFIGACVEPAGIYIVVEYCAKGSLQDILLNDNYKLDNMFIASLVFDLIKGMIFLHESDLKIHGNLKSTNCLVTSRWVLQVADFGLHELRASAESACTDENQYHRSLLWQAPELMRQSTANPKGTPKADVYAFAIILHEIIARQGTFGNTELSPKEIVERIRYPSENEEPFRPDLNYLECQDFILFTMKECWHERPDFRPDFRHIRERLNKMRQGMKSNIMDNMISMMEKYANNLEELVEERTALLEEEKKKTEALLHRMLPKSVAEELMKGEAVIPESFDAVTIYFSDIVGFTEMSASSSPMEVVGFLNDLYTIFDYTISHYEVYKVETIGDAYMVVSGLPIRNEDQHASEIASMALELLDSIKAFRIRHRPNQTLKLRIGMHTGPVVAGVVGRTMPRYCLFGDTVNTASRMESNGEALKIHVSTPCRDALEKVGGFKLEERGLIKMKGKGDMRTYWLSGHSDGPIHRRDIKEVALPQPLFAPIKDCDSRGNRRSPKMSIGELPRRCSLAIRHDLAMDDSNTTLHGGGSTSIMAPGISGGNNTNTTGQTPVTGVTAFLRVLAQDSPHSRHNNNNANHFGGLRDQRILSVKDVDKNSASCGDIPNPRALYDIKEISGKKTAGKTTNGKVSVSNLDGGINHSANIYSGQAISLAEPEEDVGLTFRSDIKRNGFVVNQEQIRPLLGCRDDGISDCHQRFVPPGLEIEDLSPEHSVNRPSTFKDGVGERGALLGGLPNGKHHLRTPLLPSDTKRWRSCDEINYSKQNGGSKSLRVIFSGLFNNKLLDVEHRRGSNVSITSSTAKKQQKEHSESVV